MYLKRLELQGFKSFARKTEFVFGSGITAIVGPNGSGKSNIADAIRWAIGETRMSQLRAKVTEDLIFAGSDGRARLGMAQVTMTLDNSDGTLPIDYAEVTIVRRAYRDGQNEFLLNGTKVRLRNIVELLGASGLTRDGYVVIGQGVVDAALTLRPEERRALIDVAAGLRPMQQKRDRALAKLDETQANLTRVYDILAELEPRLKRLERQAERARQRAELARELESALQTWYAYRWHRERQALEQARKRVDAARQALERQQEEVSRLEARIVQGRKEEESQSQALAKLRQQRAELQATYESLRRELAVQRERASWLTRRQEELVQEVETLTKRRETLLEEFEQLKDHEAALETRARELEQQLEAIGAEIASREKEASELRQTLEQERHQLLELTAGLTSNRRHLEELEQRRHRAEEERSTQEKAAAERYQALRERRQALETARAREAELDAQVAALEAEMDRTQERLRNETARQEELRRALSAARNKLEALEAQRQALAEMREDQADGAQAILAARSEIGGVIGRLVTLIRVPQRYEVAIEAALGPLLHAVVVEKVSDAYRALEWLRAREGGRATLIPLDASRSPSEPEAKSETDLRDPKLRRWGVIGIAADLVSCAARYRPLVNRLLGDVVLVPNLKAAFWLRGRLSTPMRIVTLDGVVLEPSEALTGGGPIPGRLARERAWRELPEQIAEAKWEVAQLQGDAAECNAACSALSKYLAALEFQLRDRDRERSRLQGTVAGLQQELEAMEREASWHADVARERAEEVKALDAEFARLSAEIEAQEAQCNERQSYIEELESQLQALEFENLRYEMVELEKQLALLQQQREAEQQRRAELRRNLEDLETQLASRQQQRREVELELAQLDEQITSRSSQETVLAEALEALEAEIHPVERQVEVLRRRDRELEDEITRARNQLRQAEARLSEAQLELQRLEDRLRALREKIADDVELAAIDPDLPRQLMLQLDREPAPLPTVTEIPEGLEQRIRTLRAQLRNLSGASPELLAEYEATKERYEFLAGQAADLEEAAADLRRLAQELSETMTERFQKTFEQVAEAFSEYFTRLFGGGQARLQLVEPEGEQGEAGLEIRVRLPGKRTQSLNVLSGGERALTAVALLFALLRASPTPFCVLDEVDAMLDDANIGRFRAVLEELAEKTQFIVITHNRGTIEAANAIYGVSMGETGISQVLSLRPDDVLAAA